MSSIPLTRDTPRLRLRPLQPDDHDAFVRMLEESGPAWAPWTPARDPSLPAGEVFVRELARAKAAAAAGTHVRLGGFAHEGDLVGLFALNEIVRGVFESTHASWQVGRSWMGQGMGTEGVRGLLGLAFDDAPDGLGLHRVQANIMPANEPSLRIAEKVGFRREGVALRYLRIAGRWEDHVMLAITREEWSDER